MSKAKAPSALLTVIVCAAALVAAEIALFLCAAALGGFLPTPTIHRPQRRARTNRRIRGVTAVSRAR